MTKLEGRSHILTSVDMDATESKRLSWSTTDFRTLAVDVLADPLGCSGRLKQPMRYWASLYSSCQAI